MRLEVLKIRNDSTSQMSPFYCCWHDIRSFPIISQRGNWYQSWKFTGAVTYLSMLLGSQYFKYPGFIHWKFKEKDDHTTQFITRMVQTCGKFKMFISFKYKEQLKVYLKIFCDLLSVAIYITTKWSCKKIITLTPQSCTFLFFFEKTSIRKRNILA